MKKIFFIIICTLFLHGCFQVIAFVGPAATGVAGGNVCQSAISYSLNHAVKKTTGKTVIENVIDIGKESKTGKKITAKNKDKDILKNSFGSKN